jgi:hypothetical protein
LWGVVVLLPISKSGGSGLMLNSSLRACTRARPPRSWM